MAFALFSEPGETDQFLRVECYTFQKLKKRYLEVNGRELFYDVHRIWWINRILICLIAALAAGFVLMGFFHFVRENHFTETLSAISNLREPYGRIIEEDVPEKLKDLDYVSDVKASGTLYLGKENDDGILETAVDLLVDLAIL